MEIITPAITVQRFKPGDPYYTDKWYIGVDPKTFKPGQFQSTFGQLIDSATKKFICYTLERRDTLIAVGTRKFIMRYSPHNKMIVPTFEDEPGSNTFNRLDELHIVNWADELEGCTGVGTAIDMMAPGLVSSRTAFDKVMALIAGKPGTITHC